MILQRITDRIRLDEAENFQGFSPHLFSLKKRDTPIEISRQLEKGFFVIAEVKKGSPSRGVIREDFDPVDLALAFEKAGASAVSVITEKNFFFGDKAYLDVIKKKVSLPVLRKDFIFHPFQVFESYNLGADFILLITACLSRQDLEHLYKTARSLGMGVLVEVHDEDELDRALRIGPEIIGINNRDLNTFDVDLRTSLRLGKLVPEGIFMISESGIRTREDVLRLKDAGFSGVLIGESLMRKENVENALKDLIHGSG